MCDDVEVKTKCRRCGEDIVAFSSEVRPLCSDCARTEQMEMRRCLE
ncbi:TPA: hypothetical protein HA338_06240 [Methanosarcina acetivorans]|uniref:Uncharacterized protein n=1 Tax=Methanosarcina acetivorans TaxID=2214 RepID=A0A832SHU0_9EURY|nr:hypothetical protein [Methanosarcina acetivorans]HIH93640.1 hypothetical protein [Methanosarcina acetivorans]